jgi:hypothetical protein
MLGWWAKRQMSRPVSEFLLGDDFETIIGLAFRWCNREVPTCTPESIPDEVRQMVYRLIRGFFKGNLHLRMPTGHKASHEQALLFIKDINPWRNALWRCLAQGQFDMGYLSKLYVERS